MKPSAGAVKHEFSPVQNAFGGSAISTMIYFAQQLVGVLLALER